MIQSEYKYYKKIILKFLTTNFKVVRNKTYLSPKYTIKSLTNEEVNVKTLIAEIKKVFNINEEDTIKKIIRVWSRKKITKKNWDVWYIETKLPSGLLYYMDFVYQQPQQINWEHNVDFNPRMGLAERYGNRPVNPNFYGVIDINEHQ